jgi:hypothetical protein
MADTLTLRVETKRSRLLTAVRNAAVDLANTADDHGDYVAVDAWAFKALIKSINRLMDFEDKLAPR